MKLRPLFEAARTHANEIGTGAALALAILFGLGAIVRFQAQPERAHVMAAATEPAAAPIAAALIPTPVRPAPAPQLTVFEGKLGRGQTMGQVLRRHTLDGAAIHELVTAMSPVFNFRYSKVGDLYRASLTAAGELVAFEYVRSPIESYSLQRTNGQLVAAKHEPKVIVQRALLAGVVTSNLYQSVVDLGETGELAHDFAEIFAWDVDFSKAKAGDEFRAVYERRFYETKSGPVYLGPGRILAARYANRDDDFNAVYFEPTPSHGGYYRPDGSAAQRQFLQAPLNYRRISSQYAASRLHPVLGIRRRHLGTDYAAAQGTPVWSVADGTVVFRGWNGGLGNSVRVRHRSGYETIYGHLSGFAKSLRVGDRVRQKQILGFVGSTGLSTGPHLHFEFALNGKAVNPASVRIPQGDPITPAQRGEFARVRNEVLGMMDPAPFRIPTADAL
ncbi:MAG TPA: peptidoglycan DD-metalloendopeptidase family protein [Myxococcota bacterium]|jgi:murein DD-endopeptidase MepM/ murein hydrolase activator NlpD